MATVAQKSDPSARRRGEGRRFQPGQSGNPGGRPKGLAARVREIAPADELAEYQRAIWKLDRRALRKFKIDPDEVTLADRLKAHEWLSDRGYGKAPAHAPVEGGDPLDHGVLEQRIDELVGDLAAPVDELAERREAQAPREAPRREVAAAGQG